MSAIKPEDYAEHQAAIMAIARVVENLDLEGFIAAGRRADALGPILDPTLYMKAVDTMQDIQTLAVALKRFQDEVRGIKRKHRDNSTTQG